MADADRTTQAMWSGDEATIAALAEETHTDQALVHSLYEEEFAALDAESSVKNFIGVIAARRVKKRLTAPHDHTRNLSGRTDRRSHVA